MAGVILVGAAGSGKDTVGAWIARDFGDTQLGFADPLRIFVAELLGPGKRRGLKSRSWTAETGNTSLRR